MNQENNNICNLCICICFCFFRVTLLRLGIISQRISQEYVSVHISVHDSQPCYDFISIMSCAFYRNCWRTSTKRSSNWKQFMLACYSAKMRSYIFSRSKCLPERYVYYPYPRYSFFPPPLLPLFSLFSLSFWPCRDWSFLAYYPFP